LKNIRDGPYWKPSGIGIYPFFSVTGAIDITPFKMFVDRGSYGFFLSLSFLISKAVNPVPELRHGMIEGELFEFDRVDPGFTVLLNDRTFSFCDSRHFKGFDEYRKYSTERINEARESPDCSTGDKHHMFFRSDRL
jgi:chloramphenicol O-acetyltransferase type A